MSVCATACTRDAGVVTLRVNAALGSVTALEVRRAAEEYLHPDEMQVLAVGDASDIRKPLDALGFGSSEVHSQDSST